MLEHLGAEADADPWICVARAAVDAAEILLFGPIRSLTAAELEPEGITQRDISLAALDQAADHAAA